MVADTPEDRQVAAHNLPIVRDPDFDASKDGICIQNRLTALDLGIAQVDFASAENCGALCAMKIRFRDATVHAAEYRRFPFAGMIHQINNGQQNDQADDEARTTRIPRPGSGGR